MACNRTSQVCLGPSSWQQLNSTGPSAEHSPVPWPAASPSASQSGLTLQLAPACPLPTAQTAAPWVLPTAAKRPLTHLPTLSLSQPLCPSGILPGWGTAAQVWGKDPNPESLGERRLDAPKLLLVSRVLSRLGKAPPSFLPLPHSPPPRPATPAQGWAVKVS